MKALVEPVGDLLAIDPSIVKTGVALFRAGKLVSAERVRFDKDWASLDIGLRACRCADAVMRWGMARDMSPRTLVYELPQVYTASKSKGDPNDLIKTALVAANLTGMIRYAMAGRDISMNILAPHPSDWIGQIPKKVAAGPAAWDSPRGYRIKIALSPEEFAVIVPSDDSIDAAGIGLWALGRLGGRYVA